MELTVDFETGMIEQIRQDPLFATTLLDEVNEVLTEKDSSPAQSMLRVLVMGTVGFDSLAHQLSMTTTALQKSLAHGADIDTANLGAIAQALKLALGVATN